MTSCRRQMLKVLVVLFVIHSLYAKSLSPSPVTEKTGAFNSSINSDIASSKIHRKLLADDDPIEVDENNLENCMLECEEHELKCTQDTGSTEKYSCTCQDTTCSEGDECKALSCYQGKTQCKIEKKKLVCDCSASSNGNECEISNEECEKLKCENEATKCKFDNDKLVCDCLPNYYGDICEVSKDACEALQCQNGATKCKFDNKKLVCDCLPNYYGDKCEVSKDECEKLKCENGVTNCKFDDKKLVCDCPATHYGEKCEISNAECEKLKCENGVTKCKLDRKKLMCDCLEKYIGDKCQYMIEKDKCVSLDSQCKANSYCSPENGECMCMPGYDVEELTTNSPESSTSDAKAITEAGNNSTSESPNIPKEQPNCTPVSNCTETCKDENAYCEPQGNDFKCSCLPGYKLKNANNPEEGCESECISHKCSANHVCELNIKNFKPECSCIFPFVQSGKECVPPNHIYEMQLKVLKDKTESELIAMDIGNARRKRQATPNPTVVKITFEHKIIEALKEKYKGIETVNIIAKPESDNFIIYTVKMALKKDAKAIDENDFNICKKSEHCSECYVYPRLCLDEPPIKALSNISFCDMSGECPPSTICQNDNTKNIVICKCKENYPFIKRLAVLNNFFIELCEDPCKSYTCKDNEVCIVEEDSPKCICANGFIKDEQDEKCKAYCDTEPCYNGGTCEKKEDGIGYTCKCPGGYEGSTCENPRKALQKAQTNIIVVGVVLAIVLAITIIVAFVVTRKARKRVKKYQEETELSGRAGRDYGGRQLGRDPRRGEQKASRGITNPAMQNDENSAF